MYRYFRLFTLCIVTFIFLKSSSNETVEFAPLGYLPALFPYLYMYYKESKNRSVATWLMLVNSTTMIFQFNSRRITILQSPGFIIEPALFITITYWMTGLKPTLYAFGVTTLVSIITMNISTACGEHKTTRNPFKWVLS